MLNLPNILTIARLFLLPVIFILLWLEPGMGLQATNLAFGFYVLAALTDFLDGYLARKNNQITAFGTFLDPISDKIFVACILIALIGFGRLDGLWMIPVLVIMIREFLISGLREFLGPKDIQMPVTKLAKWKTSIQMLATGLLILAPYGPLVQASGQWSLALAALITAITGYKYLKASWPHLK